MVVQPQHQVNISFSLLRPLDVDDAAQCSKVDGDAAREGSVLQVPHPFRRSDTSHSRGAQSPQCPVFTIRYAYPQLLELQCTLLRIL